MKLLLVANRLPVTINKNLEMKASVGGLATGMASYCENSGHEIKWVGWPGMVVNRKTKKSVEDELVKHQCSPVFLSKKELDTFYHGFCNKTLWPLFHYFTPYTLYDDESWASYVAVNQRFAEAVAKVATPEHVIWVHDYQLMLAPKMIRMLLPDANIGFFLHTPFPCFEVFRLLPSVWRQEILNGVLASDLIGFHTPDYTSYFLQCVERLLGNKNTDGVVQIGNRLSRAKAFPMGVDFDKFYAAGTDPAVVTQAEAFKTATKGKTILSVDRLDYSKGLINRLRGYELFLEKNPTWHKNVTLVLTMVPSREGVEHYQSMKRQIDEAVGKINGTYGGVDWTPIMYQYRSLSINELIPLYVGSDIALVTPLRDGMNLVAKEFVSTRQGLGVLILSEMAGAAHEMQEAIIINPNLVEEIAQAIQQALNMSEEDQRFRNTALQQKLKDNNVLQWAANFLSQFVKKDPVPAPLPTTTLTPS